MRDKRAVPVWDIPTRVFHWLLVLAVVVSYATGGEEGWLFVVHTASGYVVALLLLFRLIWSVIGSPHSRFGDFVYGRQAVADYVRRLLTLAPPRYVGHNPLGGWMIVLMLVVLSLAVLTGLVSGEEGGLAGPLSSLLAAPLSEAIGEVHEVFANLILLLAVVHVCGVLVDWWLTGENLISAMVSGRKKLDETLAAAEKPVAPAWRMILAAGIVAIAGVILFAKTDFAALMTTQAEHRDISHDDD